MSVSVRKNFDPRRLIANPSQIQRALGQALETAKRQIVERTQAGRDVNEAPFTGYAPSTTRQKQQAGKQTSPVNLTDEGRMLNAITQTTTVQAGFIEGRIFFNNPEDAAKAQFNSETREFFGLSEAQREELNQVIQEALKP